MKKFLLPESGNFYKANLHSHSTLSDGNLTPEEMKKAYKDRGYSIIAFTDHNIMIDHSDLKDDDFLPLRGYEVDITENLPDVPFKFKRTCHLCFIALDEDNYTQVCWHRKKYHHPKNVVNNVDKVVFDENEPDYERDYSPEKINEMIRIAREHGFFVTYNLPSWSLESYPEYTAYEGMNAYEIYNSVERHGHWDHTPHVYDDLLRTGHKIYCIAADDNHNGGRLDSKTDTSFKGFTMIKADKLDYRTITKALEDGNFYATTGPEIYSLYFEKDDEGARVHIKCSDAERIVLNTGIRAAAIKYAYDTPINEATFTVESDFKYIRITVEDASGKYAHTNAYFTDELFAE